MRLVRPEPIGKGNTEFAGATVAASHRRGIDALLAAVPRDEPVMLVLDFSTVAFATASYLKGIWLAYARAGERWLGGLDDAEVDGVVPRDVFPVVVGPKAEVRHELAVLARAERACVVVARAIGKTGPGHVALLGDLEPAVRTTIVALGRRGRASAPDLHDGENDKLTPTAWNNRLYELCRLRLAWRSKVGRQFVYQLIAPEVSYG